MARKTYKKKIKNGKEYYFHRLYDENKRPRDIYAVEVKELEAKILRVKMELSGDRSDSNKAYGDYFKGWLYDTHLVNKKPSTKELYEGIYNNYIKKTKLSKIKMKNLSVSNIQAYYNELHKLGKTTNLIKTINKLIAPSIRFAASTGEITRDFSDLLVIPQDKNKTVEKADIRCLSKEDQVILEKALASELFGALYMTALYTGLRQGELFALTWGDLDFKEKTISVNKTFKFVKSIETGFREGIVGKPKTKASIRAVPMPTVLADYLQIYKRNESEKFLRCGIKIKNKSIVFPNGVGNHLDAPNIRKDLKRICSSCGIDDFRFHDLRHTYATRLFEFGEDPKTIQTILGHSNITITLNTYTHVSDVVTATTAERLNSLFSIYNGQNEGQNVI